MCIEFLDPGLGFHIENSHYSFNIGSTDMRCIDSMVELYSEHKGASIFYCVRLLISTCIPYIDITTLCTTCRSLQANGECTRGVACEDV